MDSFDLDEITLQDLELRESGEQERVICLNRGELLTEEKILSLIHISLTSGG